MERRGQVIGVGVDRSTGNGREPISLGGRRQPSLGGTSRINREVHVRICERLGVRLLGPTRQNLMALSKRPGPVPGRTPHELTWREVRKLTATAESVGDHMKIGRYYLAKADKLEAQAAVYEEAAAATEVTWVSKATAPTERF